MKKINFVILFVFLVMLIAGLIIVFSSPSLGLTAANETVRAHGGNLDTGSYYAVVSSSMSGYRTGGMVLSLVGGFGAALYAYALLKKQ